MIVGLFFAGILVLAGGLVAAYGFANADPGRLARWIKGPGLYWIAGILAVLGTAAAIVTRQPSLLFALLGLLLIGRRLLAQASRQARNAAGPSPGAASTVRTSALEMRLDHGTGEMDGTVLSPGRLQGASLSSLAIEDLLGLLESFVRDDPESGRLLISYLDRMRPGWRQSGTDTGTSGTGERWSEDNGRARAPTGSSAMGREEALSVLGLRPGATVDEIKAAHRRLMAGLHPDRGGSDYLAAKINQAKDTLLRTG